MLDGPSAVERVACQTNPREDTPMIPTAAPNLYAVLMYDPTTGDSAIYDVYYGPDAHERAASLGEHEATATRWPVVVDVNDLIVESALTASEFATIAEEGAS